MNVDDRAKNREFMWMVIHVHPHTSTFMHFHADKNYFNSVNNESTEGFDSRVQGCVPARVWCPGFSRSGLFPALRWHANARTPYRFQLIPAYSSLFQRIFLRGGFHEMNTRHASGKNPDMACHSERVARIVDTAARTECAFPTCSTPS
jgi:hypothetical protein